jgi:cell wall-associated NlpC family hydrolase
MYLKKTILLFAILAVGCSPYPRYRTDGPKQPHQSASKSKKQSTNLKIKMGRILQEYLGRPYRGRSKTDPGLDCSLFTSEVYKKYNKTQLPRTAANQYKTGQPIETHKLKFGDLVFFITDGKKVSHVGIYVDHNEFMHASSSNGVIISSLKNKYWSKRYLGARRVVE